MKQRLRKILIVIAPPLGYAVMRILWWTTRKKFHIIGEVNQKQQIFVCWHGELFISTQVYRYLHPTQPASGIISQHFDGELIARVLEFLKIEGIRGSGRKGAKEVFLKAFRRLRDGKDLLVTPDGPRGPRHHIYDGAVALGIKGKKRVCKINFTCTSYWQLSSWDKFVIPKPFSQIDFYIESLSLDGMEMEEGKEYLRTKMLAHTIL